MDPWTEWKSASTANTALSVAAWKSTPTNYSIGPNNATPTLW